MTRAGLFMLVGVCIILVPVSGLPLGMRAVLELILGATVFLLGFSLRMRLMRSVERTAEPITPVEPKVVVNEEGIEALEVVAPSEPSDSSTMGAF